MISNGSASSTFQPILSQPITRSNSATSTQGDVTAQPTPAGKKPDSVGPYHLSGPAVHLSSWLLVLGLGLTGLGGAFGPWIWHESVALQLTGPGLAEFVKFLPDVRTGQVQVQRLFFLLPLLVAGLALPLFVENRALALPSWLRWGLRLMVIPLAMAALSPVWTPAILVAREFRVQTILAATAIGLAFVAPILKRVPFRPLVLLLVIAGLAAVILPIWHFNLVQPSMSIAYNRPVSLGWGWWLTVVGIVLSIMGGVWRAYYISEDSMRRAR